VGRSDVEKWKGGFEGKWEVGGKKMRKGVEEK
jgi:hypothetical protein